MVTTLRDVEQGPGLSEAVRLRADGVSKSFGGVRAVDRVDFEARAGEVHALLGENGAGKSTLVKLLTGVIEPTAGTVRLGGEVLRPRGRTGGVDPRLGVVFQELSLVPDLTVAENIWFGREPRRPWRTIAAKAMRAATAELFERLHIEGISPDAEVRDLPLAQRQLVEIAKVLSEPRSVVVFDEATSALSPTEVGWLLRQARRVADDGAAVLFISHRMEEIEQVADRITVLRNGQKVGERLRGEYTPDELVTLMLNRRVERLFPPREHTATSRLALSVRGLHAGRALHGVDLDAWEGEILGLGGLQGQGQAELLRALFGAVHATGEIHVYGKPIRVHSPRHALRADPAIALVPEDRRRQGLLINRSVRENATLPVLSRTSRRGILDRRKERDLAATATEQLKVVCAGLDQSVNGLSGGNQQKVVIAKMLLTEARILLLHDLTRGVDVGTKAEIFTLMRRLAHDGYTLLFYSTDTTELLNVADRIAVMFDGRVVDVLEGDDMTEERLIATSIRGAA